MHVQNHEDCHAKKRVPVLIRIRAHRVNPMKPDERGLSRMESDMRVPIA
jgi:hypothetical protein